MALTASDQALLNQMAGGLSGAGNIPWSTLLGQVMLGTPAAGTPTLASLQSVGLGYGPAGLQQTLTGLELAGAAPPFGGPSVAEQSLMGQGPVTYTVPGFGKMTAEQAQALTPDQKNAVLRDWSSVVSPGVAWPWGTLSGDALNTAFAKTLSEIGSGQYAGYGQTQEPTLPAQEAVGVVNGQDTLAKGEALGSIGGQDTLAKQQLTSDQGLKALALLASERGPANAFTQQAVLHGLDANGLSNSIGAIQGKYGLPSFSAPSANPQAAGLQSLMDQVGATMPQAAAAPPAPAAAPVVDTPNGKVSEQASQNISWKPGDVIYTDGNGYMFVQVPTPKGANWVATGTKSPFSASSFNPATAAGSSNAGTWTGAAATYTNAPAPTGAAKSGAINANPGSSPTTDSGVINPSDGGTTVFGGTHIHLNGAGGASTLDPVTAAYVNALPAPNKINGPNFEGLDDATKQFDLAAYQAAGYDPGDVLSQVSAGLPQFTAPKVGLVGASGQLSG